MGSQHAGSQGRGVWQCSSLCRLWLPVLNALAASACCCSPLPLQLARLKDVEAERAAREQAVVAVQEQLEAAQAEVQVAELRLEEQAGHAVELQGALDAARWELNCWPDRCIRSSFGGCVTQAGSTAARMCRMCAGQSWGSYRRGGTMPPTSCSSAWQTHGRRRWQSRGMRRWRQQPLEGSASGSCLQGCPRCSERLCCAACCSSWASTGRRGRAWCCRPAASPPAASPGGQLRWVGCRAALGPQPCIP